MFNAKISKSIPLPAKIIILFIMAACYCSTPADDYCDKKTECDYKGCQHKEDQCEILQDEAYEKCVIDSESRMEFAELEENGKCNTYIEKLEEYYSCIADLESCEDIREAQSYGKDPKKDKKNTDGKCKTEYTVLNSTEEDAEEAKCFR